MGSVSVYDQMKDILDEYVDRVDDVSGDCAASAAKKTASKIKDTAARKTGEYAKGWRSKKRVTRAIPHTTQRCQDSRIYSNMVTQSLTKKAISVVLTETIKSQMQNSGA